jgi:hypothetical protein
VYLVCTGKAATSRKPSTIINLLSEGMCFEKVSLREEDNSVWFVVGFTESMLIENRVKLNKRKENNGNSSRRFQGHEHAPEFAW